ncbi:MAG: response regulator transcription factor [Chitinophagaceae bacterium]|jgi:DNA-binding NarL/FixJ family response regulator|nr:response regulator transcription factor [Chitinophagaceae bacterium]
MDKIKVLVLDDHPIVLEGMQSVLSHINFVAITGLASNSFQAMELIKADKPHIVFTDISMPEINGIQFTAKLKKEYPEIKIIAMSTFNEHSYIMKMLQNGASGYILKSSSSENIEQAILAVCNNKRYLGEDLMLSRQNKEAIVKAPVLSNREKEVLQLIAEGQTNPQIASKLFISVYTVDTYRKNLLAKFKVSNTANLITTATQHGFL